MSSDVLTRDLRDRRTPAVALGVGLAAMSLFALSIYSGLRETIDNLAASFPEGLTAFIGHDIPGGYVVGELFDLIAPLALVSYAVLGGAGAVAGEEEKGTMGLLSAQPIARARILAAKAAGLVAALFTATLIFAFGTVVAGLTFDVGMKMSGIGAATLHLFFLTAAFGSISLLLGCATGRRDLAVAVSGAIAAASYVSASVLPLVGLDSWARLSLWHYYAGSDRLVDGVNPTHLLVLAAISVSAMLWAWRSFERRDLKG